MASKLRETWERQTTPGAMLILALAALMFGPRALDAVQGEPRVDASLILTVNRDGDFGVEETVRSAGMAQGTELVRVEDADGGVLCSRPIRDFWAGEIKRFWHFDAFTGCHRPDQPFRVCVTFTVASESGRRRQFPPSCTAMLVP